MVGGMFHGRRPINVLYLTAAVALAAAAISGCSSGTRPSTATSNSGSGTFLAEQQNAVLLIQWTRSGSSLSGTIDETLLVGATGGGVTAQSSSLTGTVAGNGLTLQLNPGLGSVTSLVGQTHRAGFSVTFPGQSNNLVTVNFVPSTVAAYNAAATSLDDAEYSSPCSLYVSGHDVHVQFNGPDAPTNCASFVQADPGGDGWTTVAQTPSETLSEICYLTIGDGRNTAIVDDSGGAVYGTDACNDLTGDGWSSVNGG
jgi:hypothetical protein